MFQKLWEIIAIPLGYIMRWCYLLCNDLLSLPVAYVFALFLFTVISKALLFPLSLKQQRSMATMAVYQPMIKEIQEKYKNNKEKQAEEMARIQKEYGYSPSAGCLPLLIQFPILFGLIEVIYRPLSYMIRIPKDVVSAFATAIGQTGTNLRMAETAIIQAAKTTPDVFTSLSIDGFGAADISNFVQQIADVNMSIGSVNLWETPKFGFNVSIIIPLLSVVTMIASQIITTKYSGTQAEGAPNMTTMTVTMSAMFAIFSFMYPAGFSLYWSFQNIVSIGQNFILRKIVNTDKIKAEKEAEIAELRRQKKEKKTVKVKDESGNVSEKTYTPQELARIRLQKAREIDEARYAEETKADNE